LTWMAWNTLFCICCWIRIDVEGVDDLLEDFGTSGRPVCVVMNHTSFLDTLLAVSLCPFAYVGDVKMMVSNHLLKMPGLGQIVKAMGHLDVPFKVAADSDKFEIDKEEMAKRQALLEEHVVDGGCVAWYPEGRQNRGDPHIVETFRAGGFDVAVKNDVEMWCFVCVGNTVCWPRTAAVGGRSASIGVKLFQFCESTKDYIEAGVPAAERGGKQACIYLANSSQQAVQKAVNELLAEGYSCHDADYKQPRLMQTHEWLLQIWQGERGNALHGTSW